jgi:hypothetical protein
MPVCIIAKSLCVLENLSDITHTHTHTQSLSLSLSLTVYNGGLIGDIIMEYVIHRECQSQWLCCLRHKLSSLALTLGLWVRIPLKHGCLYYVRSFHICVVLYGSRGLVMGWSRNWKSSQGPIKCCRAIIIIIIIIIIHTKYCVCFPVIWVPIHLFQWRKKDHEP